MKLAYSLLLGEFIAAEKVEYEDCKKFQLTCPGCSEPVFKGVKQFPGRTEPSHYYAHYEKSRSLIEECELRVGSFDSDQIVRLQTESRDQRLKYFLAVFSEAIHTLFKTTSQSLHKPEKLWWMVEKIKRSKPVSTDLFKLMESAKTGLVLLDDSELDEMFDFYIDEFGIEYLEKYSKQSFSIITQKRLARDFYRHLASAPAQENFRLLFVAGYFMLLYRTIIARQMNLPPTEDFEIPLSNAVFQLPELNRVKGQQYLNKLAQTVIRYRNGNDSISLLGKVQTEISHEMFGVLLKINYLQLLEKMKNESYDVLNSSDL